MLIEVRNLVVLYDKAVALRSVSIQLEEGQIVTIIGRNGAGKSTLLRTISGLVRAHTGEIWLKDSRIDADTPQRIVAKGVAHAPEGRRVFRDLSVLENLRMGAYLRKDKRIGADLDRIFARFARLAERKHQQAGSLSGGEQQMLAIGRALMSKPKVLLLDEPSMGLSPIMTKEIGEVIREINKEDGVSIILVEQNSQLALRLSHKGYVMEAGSVILEGPTSQLLQNSYVRDAYLGSG